MLSSGGEINAILNLSICPPACARHRLAVIRRGEIDTQKMLVPPQA